MLCRVHGLDLDRTATWTCLSLKVTATTRNILVTGGYFKVYLLETIFHWATILSTNLYASLWFWTKDTAEPRRLHRPLQCWFSIILRPKEVVFHDLHFLLLPSPMRNGRKREGHPCMQKGINMSVSSTL